MNDARFIATAIEITVRPGERVRFARTPVHPAAHEAYLRGRHHSSRVTEEGFCKALDCVSRAVGLEPTFAAAYAMLADVHIALGAFGVVSPTESLAHAEEAARHALELDPQLGEAHRAMALVRMYCWDWRGAEAAFERARATAAGSAETHWYYALYLVARGRMRGSSCLGRARPGARSAVRLITSDRGSSCGCRRGRCSIHSVPLPASEH